MSAPDLTLYFLQASRSIRPAWLLAALDVPYALRFSERENNRAPARFRKEAGTSVGKFPVLVASGGGAGELRLEESGAIIEYILETFDKSNEFLPQDTAQRAKVRTWIHAAEGTFMLHALAIMYAMWNASESVKESGELEKMMERMAGNVRSDLDWLEEELKNSGEGRFLVGDKLSAADIMMECSIHFIFARETGTKGGSWPRAQKWLDGLHELESYKKAVEKTGHTLFPA